MAKQTEQSRKVFAYYRTKAGQLIHYADAAQELGFDKTPVNATLNRAHTRHPEMGIRREGMAGHYVYRSNLVTDPPKAPERETLLYEKVGLTTEGDIVVRDENGRLYKLATQL
jgi:hypothetical protein